MQIDIGFGDIVYPGPEVSELPAMLDFPPPKLNNNMLLFFMKYRHIVSPVSSGHTFLSKN